MQKTIPLIGAALLISSSLSAQIYIPNKEHALSAPLAHDEKSPAGTGEWKDAQNKNTNVLEVGAQIAAKYTAAEGTGVLGVGRSALTGHMYVSARRGTATTPHHIYEFDKDGTLLNKYPCPSATSASAWGIRDMAAGGGANALYLYGGCENSATNNTVFAFNTLTNKWDSTKDWKSPATPTTVRALAYVTTGNGGKGSMITGNWGNTVTEFDQTGKVLRTIANPGGLAAYGAAYDEKTDRVWFHSQALTAWGTHPCGTHLLELDVSGTGFVWTETRGFGAREIPYTGTQGKGGIAGGLEFYYRADGRPCLLTMHQAATDTCGEVYGAMERPGSTGGNFRVEGGAWVNNAQFKIGLENGTGTAATLVMSLTNQDISAANLGFKGRIHVGFAPLFLILGSFNLTGGAVEIPLAVPNDTTLEGLTLFTQWLNNDGNLSNGGWHYVSAGT